MLETARVQFHYTYDGVGNRLTTMITNHVIPDDTITYTYDALHRLTGALYLNGSHAAEWWSLDTLGNRNAYHDSRDGTFIAYGPNNEVSASTLG